VTQLFRRGADSLYRLVLAAIGIGGVGLFLAIGGIVTSDYLTGVGATPSQPVPFSHAHHAAQLGIDCRYCHSSVETAAEPGMPPSYTCMTCHSQIWTGADMLAPVRQSLADDKPLRWSPVFPLPDYVYFDHSIHIAKGIGCSSCHGRIDDMRLTRRTNSFEMKFCLDCHRAPQKELRPADQVWNMNWQPPADQAALGEKLLAQYHIDTSGRLTDCTTCHR
jgi:hypothetical protein